MWALDIQNVGISLCMNKRSLERSHGGCLTITYNTLKEKIPQKVMKVRIFDTTKESFGANWSFKALCIKKFVGKKYLTSKNCI